MNVAQVVWSFVLLLLLAVPARAQQAFFEFDQLVGIPTGRLIVRNVPGSGTPWKIERGEARLDPAGRLSVAVEGLVPADGPNAGTNPATQFLATLSCLSADGTVNNIDTRPVPATRNGDARIEEDIELPDICLAPLIFVRAAAGSTATWLAVAGF